METGMRKLLSLLLPLGLFASVAPAPTHAESTLVFGGQICAAINPRQAQRMEWRETYLINRSEDKNYFVACPIIRAKSDTTIYAAVGLINESDAVAEILCVFREISPSGQIVRRFADQVFALEPGATDVAVIDNAEVRDQEDVFSVVCRLPPDTGVTVVAQTLQTS